MLTSAPQWAAMPQFNMALQKLRKSKQTQVHKSEHVRYSQHPRTQEDAHFILHLHWFEKKLITKNKSNVSISEGQSLWVRIHVCVGFYLFLF